MLRLQGAAGNAAVAQRLSGDDGLGGDGPGGGCAGAVVTETFAEPAGEADPLSAGGAATKELGWGDFADGDESATYEAETGVKFSSAGKTFTCAFNPSTSWAKPSVKRGRHALLRHEQYHLDLATLMAQKATAAAQSGAHTMATLKKRAQTQSDRYDAETDHSAKTAEQATWEANIDAGTVPYE